jgi:hypothetical protein
LKPIVIPKPEEAHPLEAPTQNNLPEPEPDEVPISMMPVAEDDEPHFSVPTPMPEPRPQVRVGQTAGSYLDPIPLEPAPSPLNPAAAYLVRNPESVSDLLPSLESDTAQQPDPTPLPTSYSLPEHSLPEPMFYGEHSAYENTAPTAYNPAKPRYGYEPPTYAMPTYPAPGTITGDHPAASLPASQSQRNGPGGLVVFNPTEVEAADIAAELTQTISAKMPPPQSPPSDLRISTGIWLILTSCGLGLWVYCMIADMAPLYYVAIIGASQLIIGYLWVAIAQGRRSKKQGLTTLLPPVWVYRAANPPYEPGYRPLRYVVAGAVLLTLYILGPKAQPTLYEWFGISDSSKNQNVDVIDSPFKKLVEAERQKSSIQMLEHLKSLAKPESLLLIPPSERSNLIQKLQQLRKHDRGEFRADALSALDTWAHDEIKNEVFEAIQSKDSNENQVGYELIVKWNDLETVRFLISRMLTYINDSDIHSNVYHCIKKIGESDRGRTSIEEVIVPMLNRRDGVQLNQIRWLINDYGGAKTLAILEQQFKDTKDRSQADELKRMMNTLRERIQIKPKTES